MAKIAPPTHESSSKSAATKLMHNAIMAGSLGDLLEALGQGADPNDAIQGMAGTPLMLSSYEGHLSIIDALLTAGADPNVGISNGLTPMLTACANGKIDALRRLHKAGANLLLRLEDGMGALLCASRADSAETASYLIAHGVDLGEFSEGTGLTPITLCSQAGHADTLKVLLGAGSDPMTLFKAGSRGAPPGFPQSSEQALTCLHMAALSGHVECVRLLAEHPQTDLRWTDEQGKNAAQLAKAHGHHHCAEIIKARLLSIKERSAMERATRSAPKKVRGSRI